MFDRSRKALASIIELLQKTLEAFSVILFIVFTLFYGYQIYAHIDNVVFIVIYSLLLIIHTIAFIFAKRSKVEGVTHAERDEQRRTIRKRKRIFKIVKLSINAAAIIWNVVEIFTGKVSDLRIMIVIISAVLLFAQIIMEIVLSLLIIYFDNFRIAIIEDIKGIDMDKNIVTRFVSKSLGIKKAISGIQDENYYSESEKEIARKQKEKKQCMASSVDYLNYVLELLQEVKVITYKKMMGEFMLYKDGVLFGGVYDIRFLIKKTKSLENSGLKEQIPYPNAKPMLLVDSEDPEEIKELVELVVKDLTK